MTATVSGDRTEAVIVRPKEWGIGRYYLAGEPVDFALGWEDRDRDTEWALALMTDHGVKHGSGVIVVAAMPESPWFDPFENAATQIGAPYSLCEVQPFEAFRTGLYARWVPTTMILGLPLVVLENLGTREEIAEQFGKVDAILARPDAVPMLHSAGIEPYLVFRVGPALAVECPSRSGAHINGAEWAVTSVDGDLHISTIGPRLYDVQDLRLDIRATVSTDKCGCGRTDPRVHLEQN